MKYQKYPARILLNLYNALKTEATNESRSINQQLETILKERYNAHAPPASTPARSSQFHSKTNKTNGRRVKTKAETA